MRRPVTPAEPDCLDEPDAPRPRAVIRAELRAICERHCDPEWLAWAKERFPNVWPQQLELFR